MRSLVLTKNREILVGLRMSGFEGIYCENTGELIGEYNKALSNENIGILILTQNDYNEMKMEESFKDSWKILPLVVIIPEGEDSYDSDFLLSRVKEAIGVKLD